jgi:hypothetical protein
MSGEGNWEATVPVVKCYAAPRLWDLWLNNFKLKAQLSPGCRRGKSETRNDLISPTSVQYTVCLYSLQCGASLRSALSFVNNCFAFKRTAGTPFAGALPFLVDSSVWAANIGITDV